MDTDRFARIVRAGGLAITSGAEGPHNGAVVGASPSRTGEAAVRTKVCTVADREGESLVSSAYVRTRFCTCGPVRESCGP